jgi:hypothetical protein
MLVRAPLVEAEQDGAIRIDDLTKVRMGRFCLRLAEERLVPLKAGRHIAYADDRPRAFHEISPAGRRVRASGGQIVTRCQPPSGRLLHGTAAKQSGRQFLRREKLRGEHAQRSEGLAVIR